MPYGDYDCGALISQAQETRQSGAAKKISDLSEENKTIKMEHTLAKRKLSVYETRDKRRQDGLKKAQANKKKKGAKTNGKKAK